MRKGLKHLLLTLLTVAMVLVLLLITLWKTLPQWLPAVAKHWLPPGTQLSFSSSPSWSDGELILPGVRYLAQDCLLADAQNVRLNKPSTGWDLQLDALNIDTACLSKLPASEGSGALSLADIQKQLPFGQLHIANLNVTPWQQYAGDLQVINDGKTQTLHYKGKALNFDAALDNQQWLVIDTLSLMPPGGDEPLQLAGKLMLPAALDTLPAEGELRGEVHTALVPHPIEISLNWQEKSGQLSLTEQGQSQPLINLPWQLGDKQIQILQGQWRWPYAAQPLSGGLNLTLNNWSDKLDQTTLSGRLNVLTQGHNGKGNAVLTLGPGRVGLLDSDIAFQLTGQANLPQISLSASFPGTLNGSVLNPVIALHSGALLRAWGKPTPTLSLQDARWPLAGIKLSAQGVSGPLQAIVRVSDAYWGPFQLHLNGKAQDFWPDKGAWDFNYWGNGQLPPLNGRWDVAGKGSWHDTLMTLTQLSAGFNRLSYGLVNVDAPRLTLTQPLIWQRPVPARYEHSQPALVPDFNGAIRLVAQKISLENGGYLPPAELSLAFKGDNPMNITLNGQLEALPIGPIKLNGRWDGERLRGQGWWPKQDLTAFQSLLSPDLNIKLRGGSFYAQSAFSAARGQGFVAGGHWVVKNGSMWLKDGDLSGLDFSLSYRLKNQKWQFGTKSPVSLRIGELNNLFQMQNITAELQGSYPWTEASPLRLTHVGMDALLGHISLSALRLPQHDPAVLKLQKIDLSALFTALKPKQMAMSGRVNGELPLYVDNPKWLIHDGWIANDGGLTLRLDPQFAAAMAGDNVANRLVIQLLQYLEIHRSYAKVSLDNLGELTMAAQIFGVNNTEGKQREIHLNYTHQENIYQLWRSLRFGDNLQEWLQQQLSASPSSASANKDNELRKEQ
ncbi:YdbH family protein [Rouxiella sp. S1S-2]|uniref:YdbH family protein n=1 Tax=Rouxiella sp. S1S-2 TaxID=2653856 RepID=UPI0012643DC5|nr:YdbH family protein [Rouxiella sp. S1S-2]KAB7896594.1 YdbH family protein [Rouxiella sp. S1S-2]